MHLDFQTYKKRANNKARKQKSTQTESTAQQKSKMRTNATRSTNYNRINGHV